jgi:hypothetical protein
VYVNGRNQEVRGVTHAVLLPHHHTTQQPTHPSKKKRKKTRETRENPTSSGKENKSEKKERILERQSLTHTISNAPLTPPPHFPTLFLHSDLLLLPLFSSSSSSSPASTKIQGTAPNGGFHEAVSPHASSARPQLAVVFHLVHVLDLPVASTTPPCSPTTPQPATVPAAGSADHRHHALPHHLRPG